MKPLLFMTALLGVLCMAAVSDVHAQLVRDAGVKVGVSSSSAYDSVDDLDRRTGVQAMGFIEWLNIPLFSVVTELGYVQRGFGEIRTEHTPFGQPVQDHHAHSRLDYLTTSVLAKVGRRSGVAMPYVLAGPRLDVLVDREPGRFVFSDGSSWPSLVPDLYGTTALGATLGVGLEARTGLPFSLFVEGRYDHDLRDVAPDVPRRIRNHAFSLVLGVGF